MKINKKRCLWAFGIIASLYTGASFATPGDVKTYNSTENNGAVNFYYTLGSNTGPATAWTGAISPGDHRTLTAAAFGNPSQRVDLYVHVCNVSERNCNNASAWKTLNRAAISGYLPSEQERVITCWDDILHGTNCTVGAK